jgi:hypothetical protein
MMHTLTEEPTISCALGNITSHWNNKEKREEKTGNKNEDRECCKIKGCTVLYTEGQAGCLRSKYRHIAEVDTVYFNVSEGEEMWLSE